MQLLWDLRTSGCTPFPGCTNSRGQRTDTHPTILSSSQPREKSGPQRSHWLLCMYLVIKKQAIDIYVFSWLIDTPGKWAQLHPTTQAILKYILSKGLYTLYPCFMHEEEAGLHAHRNEMLIASIFCNSDALSFCCKVSLSVKFLQKSFPGDSHLTPKEPNVSIYLLLS